MIFWWQLLTYQVHRRHGWMLYMPSKPILIAQREEAQIHVTLGTQLWFSTDTCRLPL